MRPGALDRRPSAASSTPPQTAHPPRHEPAAAARIAIGRHRRCLRRLPRAPEAAAGPAAERRDFEGIPPRLAARDAPCRPRTAPRRCMQSRPRAGGYRGAALHSPRGAGRENRADRLGHPSNSSDAGRLGRSGARDAAPRRVVGPPGFADEAFGRTCDGHRPARRESLDQGRRHAAALAHPHRAAAARRGRHWQRGHHRHLETLGARPGCLWRRAGEDGAARASCPARGPRAGLPHAGRAQGQLRRRRTAPPNFHAARGGGRCAGAGQATFFARSTADLC
mmetsp:Transcript_1099/g.4579  ORF Transcript_1099/g.4579 Transcript_1099/m.4579 type:complete len:280 (+) Transcript_1099:924-1763(+)